MRFVFITYNVALHEEVMGALATLGLKSYTRWGEVTGVGQQSGPHLNTHIWPAKNSALAVVAEDDKANLLIDEIRRMRNTLGKGGMKAFCWRVEDIT